MIFLDLYMHVTTSALMNQEKNEKEKSTCMPITWENCIALVSQRIK